MWAPRLVTQYRAYGSPAFGRKVCLSVSVAYKRSVRLTQTYKGSWDIRGCWRGMYGIRKYGGVLWFFAKSYTPRNDRLEINTFSFYPIIFWHVYGVLIFSSMSDPGLMTSNKGSTDSQSQHYYLLTSVFVYSFIFLKYSYLDHIAKVAWINVVIASCCNLGSKMSRNVRNVNLTAIVLRLLLISVLSHALTLCVVF